jgi:transcriptional regulator with XRE-family HTH domain
MIKMTFGERVKLKREQLGLSQDELASKLGFKSRSSINKIEKDINDVTQTIIYKLSLALETTPAYLMGWEDELEIKTIAAHATEDLTEEEQQEVLNFVKFLKSKRSMNE